MIARHKAVLFPACAAALALTSCAGVTGDAGSSAGKELLLVQKIARQAGSDYPGLDSDPQFERVLAAIGALDRRDFVPVAERAHALQAQALPIGYGQTISDPYIVALMTWAVGAGGGSNVLEVGTGSGYQAAVLDRLGARVHTIEIVPELARQAAARLARIGMEQVTVKAGDGFLGWPPFAPFDAIIVTAGSSAVPQPLLHQLRKGGKLVMPIGASTFVEQLVVYTKGQDGAFTRCSLGPAMFVPLTGRGEQPDHPGLYDRSIKLCWPGQKASWPGQTSD